jgi:FkbM family methyltransferase
MNYFDIEILTPETLNEQERVQLTTKCRDADFIPRVKNAGMVISENGKKIQILHNGIKVLAGGYYGDWMQDLILKCKGVHEPQEEAFFYETMKHIHNNATMIEVGSYWSFYSIWFLREPSNSLFKLKKKTNRRCIAIEPDPIHLDIGKQNAELNNCSPEFINAFIAEENSLPTEPFLTEKSGLLSIPSISIPTLMEDKSIEHLDILHLDCQGQELSVIRSCEHLFKKNKISWLFISTHSHQISGDPLTHQRCLQLLIDSGASILGEHDVHESFSGDGFICAKFGDIPKKWISPKLTYNRYSKSLFRNPLYDLSLAKEIDEEKVVSFIENADSKSRAKIFDAFNKNGTTRYLYTNLNNISYIVNTKDSIISKTIYSEGNFESDIFEIAINILKKLSIYKTKFDVFFDIGANIGTTSIPVVINGYAKEVIAIEPDDENCRQLYANISLNGLNKNIQVVEMAAGEIDNQILRFNISEENFGDHRIAKDSAKGLFNEEKRMHKEVKSITLDSFLNYIEGKSFMIHMDTQGYEGHILSGSKKVLESKPPLILEFWPYGLIRSDGFKKFTNSINHYKGFFDLRSKDNFKLRPLEELQTLFDDLRSGTLHTDILVI